MVGSCKSLSVSGVEGKGSLTTCLLERSLSCSFGVGFGMIELFLARKALCTNS